jgi:hypothetical protein
MFTLKVRTDLSGALDALSDFDKQSPYAMARALTLTGKDIFAAETREIAAVIDKPTPYTSRAVKMTWATKTNLRATVWLKDGNRPEHYLLPMIEGGQRPLKRFEQRLRMNGLMRSDERAVSGSAAQLDAYGNISRGQIVKILSQLRTAVVSGDFSNASNSKRSKAKRVSVAYFASAGDGGQRAGRAGRVAAAAKQHLPRGIWERRVHAWGTSVRPVLLFVKGTRYPKQFDFFGVADRVVTSQFPKHLTTSVEAINRAFFNQGRP